MEWLKEVLKDVENSEDLMGKIKNGIGKNFVAREDFNTVKADKKRLEEDIVALKEENEGGADFKKKFEDLQEAVRLDKEAADLAEKEAKAEAEHQTRFTSALGENKWRDELTGEAVYGAFKKALADESNKGKGDKDIFEALTKDKDYYQNPNKPGDMPGMGNTGVADVEESTMRAIMGLPAKE